MQTIKQIKEKFLFSGVKEDNIDFAISAVKEGNKREHILESLTADYRGMRHEKANRLLDALYEAVGGEFKKENNTGYLYGILLLLIGITGAGFFIAMLLTGEWKLKFLAFSASAAFIGLVRGTIILLKTIKGDYRETGDVFEGIYE